VTRVVNDTLKQLDLVVHYGWMRVDGSDSRIISETLCMEANSMAEVARDAIANPNALNPREWMYIAYLTHGNNALNPSVWLLVPHRELALPDPDIHITVEGKTIQLISKTYCHGVHFRDKGKAVFSDNYFDLLPGIPKSITCLASRVPKTMRFYTVP